MLHPAELNPKPSIMLLIIGGIVGTILLASLLFLAPAFGLPSINVPLLIGGIFTTHEVAAFWLGFALFFFTGAFVFAPALQLAWIRLPGKGFGLRGAMIKGLLWGAALWLLAGLTLPLFGWLNRLDTLPSPGFFALGTGIVGAAGFLAGHLFYGLVISLTTAMSRGIMPLELIGWYGHGYADVPEIGRDPERRPGHDAPREEPKAVRS